MGNLRFEVGEAFPGDDPTARWVAGLIIISNDLARPHRRLHNLVQETPESAEGHKVYWLILGAAHLREAVKFLDPNTCPLIKQPEVEQFIADLPEEASELLDGILREIQPWKESWLYQLAKPLRDRLFHYTGCGSDGTDYTQEIGKALEMMRHLERDLAFSGRNIDWHWSFGEEIRLNWIAQAADLSDGDYMELVKRSNELAGRMVKFAGLAIRTYLESRLS